MKPTVSITLFVSLFILFLACEEQEENTVQQEEVKVDLVNDEFAEAEQEVRQTMDAIVQSVKDGDIDKLISFHAYGPKFTEFKNGEPRNGSEDNETHERSVFGSVSEVVKMDMNDMKIAVYGDVANVTLHSDFHLKFGEDLAVVNDQITLLFVRTDEGWKIVHEHHSPLKQES